MNAGLEHTVVYTRPEASPAFERQLTDSGCAVHRVPLIRIAAPESWRTFDAALDRLGVYAGILLTSRQAARFFSARVAERGIDRASLPPLHAVGAKTAEEAARHGLPVYELPSAADGATLAAELPDVRGCVYLQPCSNIAREEVVAGIRARGGEVEQVTVYRTLPAADEDLHALQRLQENGIDCVAFFSPSAVRQFAAAMPDWRQDPAAVAVIGGTTGAEAQAQGMRVDIVAHEQTAESLAAAIIERLC